MSEKKDQLKEILKDQLNREAKQIEEEVGLNDNEEIPNELKIRMKNALDQKIREREMRSEDMKRTDAYAKLSEEDQEALRLGREMLKNQSEEKKIYTMRRKKRNIRRIVALAAVLILVMAVYVFAFPKYVSEQVMTAYFGVFYVAIMLSYIYQTRLLKDGLFLVGLVFLCSWGCDTCAYCVGVLIGKHKMAPKLSPKKSIEGGIGGLAGAALLGALYALAINKWGGASAGVGEYAMICFVGGIISMIGDLAASAIKRNHEIKDYGKLIPGHGGILDRFDSVIFTAPVIYYLAVALM